MARTKESLFAQFPPALREQLVELEPRQYLQMTFKRAGEGGALIGSESRANLLYSEGLKEQPELAFLATIAGEDWKGGWGSLSMKKYTKVGEAGDRSTVYEDHTTVWLRIPNMEELAEETDGNENEQYAKALGFVNQIVDNIRGLVTDVKEARQVELQAGFIDKYQPLFEKLSKMAADLGDESD